MECFTIVKYVPIITASFLETHVPKKSKQVVYFFDDFREKSTHNVLSEGYENGGTKWSAAC